MHARSARRVAMVVLAGVMAAGCGSGSESTTSESSSVSSSAPSTTASPTTVAPTVVPTSAPSTTAAPTTSVAAVTVDAFEPDCVERGPARPARAVDQTGFDELVPLGAEPVMQVLLPRASGDPNNSDWVRVGAFVVPGGILLALSPYNGIPQVGMITLVDNDGVVRWVRCLPDGLPLIKAPATGDGDELGVAWITYDASGVGSSQVEMWSLADGQVSRTWEQLLADNGIDPVDDEMLTMMYTQDVEQLVLGRASKAPFTDADRLYVVDLPAGSVRTLEYPPTALGLTGDSMFMDSVDGRLVHTADLPGLNAGRIVAVEDGDSWSTDPADLDAARPARSGFLYSDGMALFAVDGTGDELWRRTDYLAVPAEGFSTVVSADVALARVCTAPPTDDDWCPGRRMVAVDASSGRTLWEREGWWNASVVTAGRALLAGPFGDTPSPAPVPWTLVDLRTGEQVGAQTWSDPWRFSIGCCDEPAGVTWNGGVVVSYDENTVELWYPEARTTPLVVVDLAVD